MRLEIQRVCMSEKDTIAAQVRRDSPLHQRFEEYEEERRFESRSEAVRSLLRAGLDKHEAEKAERREEAQTLTSLEEWCQEKYQSWAGAALLAAVALVATSTLFIIQLLGIVPFPQFWVSAGIFVSLSAALALGGAAGVVWLLLTSGYARRLSVRFTAEDEVAA